MEKQELIEKMTGYKATNKDMKCRGVQFELGVWHEVEGPLVECEHGFHFCEQPSGVWVYYSGPETRVFKIEAERVLATPFLPGASYKRVCHRIRFIEEVFPDGNGNTGYGNTGNDNTGNDNTGNGNTGYGNTGNDNTGNGNTGYGNTGNGNTGNDNTGNDNTGYRNTGYGNTGNGNTGYGNTGNDNTGNDNTGNGNTGNDNTGNDNTGGGNATDWSSGFFCQDIQTVKCFDVDTSLAREVFVQTFPEYRDLTRALSTDEKIPFEPYKNLPGITKKKLASLHEKFIAARVLGVPKT